MTTHYRIVSRRDPDGITFFYAQRKAWHTLWRWEHLGISLSQQGAQSHIDRVKSPPPQNVVHEETVP